jgi:hypothetical protein
MSDRLRPMQIAAASRTERVVSRLTGQIRKRRKVLATKPVTDRYSRTNAQVCP